MNKKSLLFATLLILSLLATVSIWAQTPPPPPGGTPPGFPVDGGIILLAAVAIGYGVSKKK
jgi:hypothetical protein